MPGGIKIIGLTGGIATGKSSVALFFSKLGVPIIDADQLARDAVLPGSPALERIISLFGRDILTNEGILDRKHLAVLIFSDADKRSQLESVLHPEIRKMAVEAIDKATADGHQRLIYMAPLLIEAGATERVDTIWVVTVRPEVQLERLMKRDDISLDQALCMVASQMPLAEKEQYGSVIIDNSGTWAETLSTLESVWAKETGSINE
ncbi:MAG: dephospho-CoA kinase [Desulfuromonadales bacterium]